MSDPSTELEALRAALASGEASDGYHTHRELYEYRMLYNAHAAQGWLAAGIPVVKSWNHSDGGLCFGGGWFIVTATLPTGQVSNHYKAEHWDLFNVPAVKLPPEYDGHTPADASSRLAAALRGERALRELPPQGSHAEAQMLDMIQQHTKGGPPVERSPEMEEAMVRLFPRLDSKFERARLGEPPTGSPDARDRLAVLIASYEMDEPYWDRPSKAPEVRLDVAKLRGWLAEPHCGDCTSEPQPCSRCLAEHVWHKTEWIRARIGGAAPPPHTEGPSKVCDVCEHSFSAHSHAGGHCSLCKCTGFLDVLARRAASPDGGPNG